MSIDWSSVVEHGRRPIRAAMIGVAIWLVGRFWR